MTRTAAREIAIQISFRLSINKEEIGAVLDEFFDGEYYATLREEDRLFSEYPDPAQMAYIRRVTRGVGENLALLDSYIEKYAKNWRLHRISKTAAAILRTAMYEILYMDEIPDAAAINEAVELAKGYEEAETVAFINGVLGSFVRAERPSEKDIEDTD